MSEKKKSVTFSIGDNNDDGGDRTEILRDRLVARMIGDGSSYKNADANQANGGSKPAAGLADVKAARFKKAVDHIKEQINTNKITSIVAPEPKSVDPDDLSEDDVSVNEDVKKFKERVFFENGGEEEESEEKMRSAEDIMRDNSAYPEALNRSLPQIVSHDEIDAMNRTFFKCKLCHLMFGNADVEELNKYVRLGRDSMNTYGIFPLDSNNTRDTDAMVGEESYHFILDSTDVAHKKAFIWITLFTCRSFVAVFCPPINSHRQYACDPNLLYEFVEDEKSTFPEIVARYIIGNYSIHLFNALCTAEWFEKSPWHDMDNFKNLHPSDISLETQFLSGFMNKIDNQKAQHSLSLAHDYYHTRRDELGSQKKITQAKAEMDPSTSNALAVIAKHPINEKRRRHPLAATVPIPNRIHKKRKTK